MTDVTDHGASRFANPSLGDLVAQRYSRRDALRGGASAAALTVIGGGVLAACSKGNDTASDPAPTVNATASSTSVAAGARVTITGTATDNGAVSSTAFTQVGGPAVTLSATTGTSTSFIAPATTVSTPVVIRFSATDNSGNSSSADAVVTVAVNALSFAAVAKNRLDVVTVPAGHSASVLYRTGDPIAAGVAAYRNDGTDTGFAGRAGDHHDGIRWYGLTTAGARDDQANARGLLVMNHEGITPAYLHPAGPTAPGGARPEAEAIKEIEAHGVSIVETIQAANGGWSYVAGSSFNRRVTPNTPVVFNGPVRGNALLQTAFSTAGTDGRGTISNCGTDATPWGTQLSAEEDWAPYFRRPAADNAARTAKEQASLARYGLTRAAGLYGWETVSPADGASTLYRRWNAQATGASAAADFRNEPNQFGWVVEVDPYDATKAPRKRTALGRMNHANAIPAPFVVGRKPAVYMGDGAANEYLYKFVSNTAWASADAANADRLSIGDKYLDAGTLYVAVFAADGNGTWVPLTLGTGAITATNATYAFADQADVLANARLAGDLAGATRMDSPEWAAVQPVTGEIYLALNGNPTRTSATTNAANPRAYQDPPSAAFGNRNGHILRVRETGDSGEATTFKWDVYVFGAGADLDAANINVSALDASNDFSGPDALAFARPSNPAGLATPLMWIQTDDAAYTDVTNNQMLAALPGTIADGGTAAARTITNRDAAGAAATQATLIGKAPGTTIKRFLVGPVEAEVTGVDSTPDGRTLFVNIQHPGLGGTAAAPTSNWPANQAGAAPGSRPRSATVVITRNDGGVVGL